MKHKTYGTLEFDGTRWRMDNIPPHIAIRLKHLFPRLAKTSTAPFHFEDSVMNAADLCWFTARYPMEITPEDQACLDRRRQVFEREQAHVEHVLTKEFVPPAFVGLKPGQQVRHYQAQAVEMALFSKRLLLGDDLGLGKTYSAAAFCLSAGTVPAAIVVQPHLQAQWAEKVTEFTTLRVHCIKGTRPYPLPDADIYIFRYTQIAGWVDFFATRFFNTVIYDEVQELRRGTESAKGAAARVLSQATQYTLALSATPIYNYGAEIWNIFYCMNSPVLGQKYEFMREWLRDDRQVENPEALGSYLRESQAFLRRRKVDVGQQMPPVNIITEVVENDPQAIVSIRDVAQKLARIAMSGSFVERGQAGRELDMLVRQATGVGKARHVAAFAKLLLQSGIPIILCGWHRAVYEIWLDELKEFKPVMYTGSESALQKKRAVDAFMAGETNCFIMSLRSGAGVDGLQSRCSTVLFGEFDWSKKIHEQVIGRLDREGQVEQVLAIYLACLDGSDPPIMDMLAIKAAQAQGIVDPGLNIEMPLRDDSRIKALARVFLSQSELKSLSSIEQAA